MKTKGQNRADDTSVSSRKRLDHLLKELTTILPSLPGFQTLSLFGSLAEGRADGYSDIDLIVTTDDLLGAKERLLGTLEEIGVPPKNTIQAFLCSVETLSGQSWAVSFISE